MFGAAWSRTEERPAARGALVLASSAAAVFLGYIWWPNGDYRPIQPGEKGTIQGALQQFAAILCSQVHQNNRRRILLEHGFQPVGIGDVTNRRRGTQIGFNSPR